MNMTTVPSNQLKAMQHQLAAQELVIQQLNALLSKFRDDVMFKIGSASPYRHLANGYWGHLKQILPIEPSTEHLEAWYMEMVGEPVAWNYELTEEAFVRLSVAGINVDTPLHAIKPFPFKGE